MKTTGFGGVLAIVLTACVALIPGEAAADAEGNAITGAGAASFPAATTFGAVTLSGIEFGQGVFVAPDGSASGHFHAVLLGASLLGQARQITVEGKVRTGGVGTDGGANVGGTAAIDLGDG